MPKIVKNILRKLYRNSGLARRCWFWLRFAINNRYIPDFNKPRTYNEKINYRKVNAKHPLFSICADKIKAKEYVAEKIGAQYVIPNLYTGNKITLEKIQDLLSENGDCFLKANHNSGPVFLLTADMCEAQLKRACDEVNHQLTVDFGKYKNEPWYSDIEPRVLVEKRIFPEEGEKDLKDYKFHVFKQDHGGYEIVLHVDFNRNTNHNRSFFDEKLNWLPFSMQYPCIKTQLTKPVNYEAMLSLAQVLADDFSYVRVDFYNEDGQIYFGEMTFAHGSGGEVFTTKSHDDWMGNLWKGDPSY